MRSTLVTALWFRLYRRGGRIILHHSHIRPVLLHDWSPKMDGIAATIWASQTTLPLEPDDHLNLATSRARTGSASSASAHPALPTWTTRTCGASSGGITVLWTDEPDQAMVFDDAAAATAFCRDSPLEMFVVLFVPASGSLAPVPRCLGRTATPRPSSSTGCTDRPGRRDGEEGRVVNLADELHAMG